MTNGLSRVAFGEHHFIGGGIESGEKFRNQPSLGRTGFARRNQITNDCVNPGHFIDTENDPWMLTHLQFVHWCAGKQIAVDADAFHHLFAEFLFDDLLHRFCDELQITLISDLKFDFVPDVREKRPRIVVDKFVEHFFVWKLDDPAARMIAGNILAAKFPQRGVEITHVDDVSGGIIDSNAVPDTIRLADEEVDPADETFHRSLHSQSNNDGNNANRGERSIPIYEKYRDGDKRDQQRDDQMFDASESETCGRVFDLAQDIDRDRFRNREHDHNERGTAQNAPGKIDVRLRKGDDFRSENNVENRATDEQKCMCDEPEFVRASRLDLFARLFTHSSREFFADFRFFGNFFCGFRHQL